MNYALKDQTDCWLRHPVLGDPSFDCFTHREKPVVTSEPPYEWTVNGSLFRDPVSGKWLLQAGRYHYGYAAGEDPSYCDLFLSEDEGKTFRAIGPALSPGSPFKGIEHTPTSFPDTVVEYDPVSGKYYMAYDTSDPNFTWERSHDPNSTVDGGGAVAVADRVEGPYRRLPGLSASRIRAWGKMGRFSRLYATTLLRREKDWLLMVLCDSNEHFAWAYAALTAPSPEGPWSDPVMVLNCDTPDFYPTPVEFHPCMVVEGRVYAHATSVAKSRNYQALFSARWSKPISPAHGRWSRMALSGTVNPMNMSIMACGDRQSMALFMRACSTACSAHGTAGGWVRFHWLPVPGRSRSAMALCFPAIWVPARRSSTAAERTLSWMPNLRWTVRSPLFLICRAWLDPIKI